MRPCVISRQSRFFGNDLAGIAREALVETYELKLMCHEAFACMSLGFTDLSWKDGTPSPCCFFFVIME